MLGGNLFKKVNLEQKHESARRCVVSGTAGMKSFRRKKAKKPSKKEVKARLELNDYASKISLAQQDAMQVREDPD